MPKEAGDAIAIGDLVWLPHPPLQYLRHRIGTVTDIDPHGVVSVDFGRVLMQGAGGVHSEPTIVHQCDALHLALVTARDPMEATLHV
jgi:hypothetical protein